jgi:hypothetical protein
MIQKETIPPSPARSHAEQTATPTPILSTSERHPSSAPNIYDRLVIRALETAPHNRRELEALVKWAGEVVRDYTLLRMALNGTTGVMWVGSPAFPGGNRKKFEEKAHIFDLAFAGCEFLRNAPRRGRRLGKGQPTKCVNQGATANSIQ